MKGRPSESQCVTGSCARNKLSSGGSAANHLNMWCDALEWNLSGENLVFLCWALSRWNNNLRMMTRYTIAHVYFAADVVKSCTSYMSKSMRGTSHLAARVLPMIVG
jgi:hypothetical protein